MLVQFSFGNFRSFKDQATLSLVAASKLQADPERDRSNVFVARARPQLELLRVAALYGANASGKSNVSLALKAFQTSVVESANVGFVFPTEPFRLNFKTVSEPTYFEIIFVLEEIQYRYGFEVTMVDQTIQSEWLYRANSGVETTLFEREGDSIKRGRRFSEGKYLLDSGRIRRTDALFLSLVAQNGEELCADIVSFVQNNIKLISGLEDSRLRDYTIEYLKKGRFVEEINDLLRAADTGIPKVSIEEDESTGVTPDGIEVDYSGITSGSLRDFLKKKTQVFAFHNVMHESYPGIEYMHPFQMASFESQGTQKLFAFAGPILETLQDGYVLFVDEMDARFHPLLTQSLIRLFQSPESNPKNAQLIFITHDTNLLDTRRFRRDQIWFVEKDRFGGSHLYSLADFKGVRKDASFEDEYFRGRYGAIPFLGGLDRLFRDEESSTAETASPDDSGDTTSAEPIHAEA